MANLLRLIACLFFLLSFNAFAVDTDGDGFSDADEATLGTDPNDPTSPLENKLTASDGAASDYFGLSVSIDGDTVVIGAKYDDDNGSGSGSAYVYVRTNGVWGEQAKLTASDAASADQFGVSVSIDDNTAVIGAPFDDDNGSASGSAYVFVRNNGVWSEQAKLTASDGAADDTIGLSVSIDGDTAVIGAPFDDDNGSASGSAYVFVRNNGVWSEQAKLTAGDGAADDWFGYSVSIDGETIVIGAHSDSCSAYVDNCYHSGSAYVFVRNDGVWNEQQKLTASDGVVRDYFGREVAIDGETIVIGAYNDDDNVNDSGSAYVFVRNNGLWSEQAKLTASDGSASDWFGYSVSIEGETIVIGALRDSVSAYVDNGYHSGSAYVFVRNDGVWNEQQKLTASDGAMTASWIDGSGDNFGISVSIDGDTAVIGAHGDDDICCNSGSAYIFPLGHQDTPALITGTTSANVFVGGVGKGTFIATDIDGLADADYFTISIPPVNGQALINAATGNWVYMANNSFVGSDPFTVTITDDLGGITEQDISISVSDVSDIDSDGAYDHQDNCPSLSNADQSNLDGDSYGDACDLDIDGDLILDSVELAAGTDPNDPNEGPQEITETLGVNKNVPAMGGIGLLALGLSMLGLGAVRSRRRH